MVPRGSRRYGDAGPFCLVIPISDAYLSLTVIPHFVECEILCSLRVQYCFRTITN